MALKSTTKVETNKHELVITVSGEEFEAACQKAYEKNRKKINVPGFRPGKAPRKIIEKEYGEGAFYDDAINAVYPQALAEAVEEAGLVLVDRPQVEAESVSKEDGVVFKAICITRPEVEISDYKGIEVTKTVDTVTDEDINGDIERLREKGVRIISVEDRAVQNDDEVIIDFEGFVDNVAFDGGKAEKFSLTIGSGQFIPGFEEQIVGHNIGEEFDVNVMFPAEYQEPSLAGKPAVFKIKLHEIKARELPVVDDEFVKDTTEFNNIDELKADIKTKLEEAAANKADMEVENKIIENVIGKLQVEIPEVMYERRVDEMVQDFAQRLASQGMNIDIYLQYTGMDMDAFRKTFEEQAQNQVKLRLALEKIAEIEKIEVSDEDADAELAKMAEAYKMEVDQVKQYVTIEDIKKDVQVSRAVELVKEAAVIK